MKRHVLTLEIAVLVLAWAIVLPAAATAKPSLVSPAAGAYVPQTAEAFSWTDNYAEGPIDHWYLEISTSPDVDTYYFGFFSGPVAYASSDLRVTSLNLGGSLPPGTYYWHVVGFYGRYGINGTYWSPVRSFTVQNTSVAPGIAVSPASLYFTVQQGDTSSWWQQLSVSNKGGGFLKFVMTTPVSDVSWFGLDTSPEGSFNTGQIFTQWVGVNATGKLPGIYTSAVTVQDDGSSPPAVPGYQTVPVTLKVVAAESNPPTGCSLKINGGASATNKRQVTLGLSAADAGSGMGEVRLDNNDGVWTAWGDYSASKTAILPAGDGLKTVRAQFRDKLGNTATAVSDSILLDTTPPGKTSVSTPYYSTSESKTYSFKVKWEAADNVGGAGIAGYEVSYRVAPSTTWTTWGARRTGTSALFSGSGGKTYQFRARAIDGAGNYGAYSDVQQAVVPYDQSTGAFSGSWKSVAQSSAYQGKVKSTSRSGASVTFAATGRSYSLIVTKGAGRSRARVYVDGKYVKTIDTRASSTRYRQRVFLKSFTSPGLHKVRIVNRPTSGRTKLQVDGLAVVR